MDRKKIIIRADGSNKIGLGHVTRCLALATMLESEFDCAFAIQNPSSTLLAQIKQTCNEIFSLPPTPYESPELKFELDPFTSGHEIVVLDGYGFGTEYQKHLKNQGCIVVCIDDIHAYHFVADLVINHAGGQSKESYSVAPFTQLLLGPAFALLRQSFLLSSSKLNRRNDQKMSLFLNMGGADPGNITCEVLEEIIKKDSLNQINVITGAAYQHERQLKQICASDHRVNHFSAIGAEGIADLMQTCDIAVCPPSTVAFEYCSLGGLLFLKQIADNQSEVKRFFLEQKVAFDFDKDWLQFDSISKSEKEAILRKQSELIDRKSGERLLKQFRRQSLKQDLIYRPANENDLMLVYQWANDPEVRKASFDSRPITLADHTKWFLKKIKDSTANYYIIERSGKPIGQIRFDGSEEKVIGYLLAPESRGTGLGTIVLTKGVEILLKENFLVKRIFGYVKKENIASCKAFESAGFILSTGENMPYINPNRYELLVN